MNSLEFNYFLSKYPIRGKISPHIETLNLLHSHFPWIPNSTQIRPTEKIRQKKFDFISQYKTWEELFADSIFQCKTNELFSIKNRWTLLSNSFPYNVPIGTWHDVLWILSMNTIPTDEEIENYLKSVFNFKFGKTQAHYI